MNSVISTRLSDSNASLIISCISSRSAEQSGWEYILNVELIQLDIMNSISIVANEPSSLKSKRSNKTRKSIIELAYILLYPQTGFRQIGSAHWIIPMSQPTHYCRYPIWQILTHLLQISVQTRYSQYWRYRIWTWRIHGTLSVWAVTLSMGEIWKWWLLLSKETVGFLSIKRSFSIAEPIFYYDNSCLVIF